MVICAVLARFGPQPAGWGALPWYVACFVGGILLAGLLHLPVETTRKRAMRRWWDDRRNAPSPRGSATLQPVDLDRPRSE
jgi:peptidoglycan/LPS O-acetylase OafA/YrhL